MVTKRKRVILASVGVAVVTALVWHFSRPSQPSRDCRTLTQWMSALGSSDSDEEAHAFAAIEAIGTNGLPTITRLLTKTDSPLKLRCLALLDRVPFLRLRVTTAAEWRQKAKVALILSGEDSQHASISTLASLSRHSNPAVRLTAVDALSQFMFTEPACLPPLEVAQSDIDVQVRTTAHEAVQRLRGVSNAVERLRERATEMRSPDKLSRNLLIRNVNLRQLIELLPRRRGGWCANHQRIGKDSGAEGASPGLSV